MPILVHAEGHARTAALQSLRIRRLTSVPPGYAAHTVSVRTLVQRWDARIRNRLAGQNTAQRTDTSGLSVLNALATP